MNTWRWTFQARLWTILGFAVLVLLVMALVDRYTSARLDHELTMLEGDYLPLIEFGADLDTRTEAARRALQDAVAAQDQEALDGVRSMRDAVLARLDDAPRIVDRAALIEARRAFEAWFASAIAISERMLKGEAGVALVTAVGEMHERQRTAWDLMRKVGFLDRSRLHAAFSEAREAQQDAANSRLAVLLALLALLALLVFSGAARLVRSFNILVAGFSRFGGGDFAAPIELSGSDELTHLAKSANQMAERLHEAREHLQAKQHELEAANRELEAFSYSVSHDLRAPLRGIDGFSQALLEEYGSKLDAEGQGYLQRVRAAAQRMAELIDDLLSLSRLGRAELRREEVNVAAVIQQVVRQLETNDPARKVEWVISDGMMARADRRLLTVIFENLLGNAWKFTSKQAAARIEVGVRAEDGEQVHFVRDNGAGFDMAYASKLFGAFQRLHSATDYEGTGIGLATVSRIVHRHDGRVWADSVVGRGATFYFTLGGRT